jgi:radical SAM protein with 4Fe4S-binding SPASM domain
VLTNGSGLNDEVLAALLNWRKGIYFQYSLYGTDTRTGADITSVPDSFETAFSGVLALHRNGFDLRVALLVISETADGLPALVAQLRELDIRTGLIPQLSVLENGDTVPLMLRATDDQIIRVLPLEGNWAIEPNEPTAILEGVNHRTVACAAGVTSLGIRADGSILPCQVFTAPILGHVSTDSLESVLRGPARAQFLAANVIPDKCSACDLISNCMRCPADAMFETGELTGIPQESCRIARLRAKMHVDSK